ncbi:hypothetical protein HMPREF1978_00528 [Actinomyces graevenitzii F0530]|uniref:Uncharacterized protein n=1 Tax=Actinomyces graevenitzii F0530 TaxID=1321817 RepID=U1Q4D4_9ACTO|nr:hypothetical protein HMPREF1978_00528 [Actinomyces graevenitzii F0530]
MRLWPQLAPPPSLACCFASRVMPDAASGSSQIKVCPTSLTPKFI